MKTKPNIIRASGCFTILLIVSFFITKAASGNSPHDRNCTAGFPFEVSVSGFSLSGHVCGENKIKNIPQVNFRVKAEDPSKND